MSTRNQNSEIRIGVIGCGAIADIFHLPVLAKLASTRGGIALADTSEQRLAEMAEKYSAAVTVTDYRELLGKVDGVLIATPPAAHFSMVSFFLENKIPVLCEKPLTESAEDARELSALSKVHNTALAVNQTRRFFPSYRVIRELIASGELGDLQSITYHDGIEFSWPAASPHHFAKDAKGALSDSGVHLLDTIVYWLGDKPKLVSSLSDSQGGPDALATVSLEHKGCEVEIKVSRLGKLFNGFRIVGSKAKIEAGAEDFGEVTIQYNNGTKKKKKCGSSSRKYTDMAQPLIENFVEVIASDVKPKVSVDDVVGTIELLEQAYEEATNYPTPWNDQLEELASKVRTLIPEQSNPKVLITGGNGFLGARIAEVMHLTDLGTPIPTIRQWSRASRLARFGMDIRILDILEPDTIDAALKDVDVVIHCAKVDSRESIVGGTRNMLEGCVRHGIKRFVHLSTAEVYGPDVKGEIDEENSTPTTGRLYGDAKVEAESVCLEFRDKGVETVILRPSLIHGLFSESWTNNIVKRLRSGKWGLFDEMADGIANLVHVDDLVQAILLSAFHPSAGNQAFNVNGDDTVTWNEYFNLFNDRLELPPLKVVSSSKSKWKTWIMSLVSRSADVVLNRYEDKIMEIYMRGGLAHKVMKRIKGEVNSTPDPNELHDLFQRAAHYDDRKASSLIDYSPASSLKEEINSTIHWLRLHEYIDTIPSDLQVTEQRAEQPALSKEVAV
jgi:predicted dehydrogenase/nucleoside-diphosphate-sugar epimerase